MDGVDSNMRIQFRTDSIPRMWYHNLPFGNNEMQLGASAFSPPSITLTPSLSVILLLLFHDFLVAYIFNLKPR